VIGKVHQNTAPALNMLEQEGFANLGYVDIFDGGPTIEANIKHIRAVNGSEQVQVRIDDEATNTSNSSEKYLIANEQVADFRCTLFDFDTQFLNVDVTANQLKTLTIPSSLSNALNVNDGDSVRIVALKVTLQ
jgi:arginine N-succinyltransferase